MKNLTSWPGSGLRIGEVLALRWRNVDFERSLIHVREAVYEGNLSSPKSRSSIRDIPIGPTLQQSLLECRKDALADAFVFASRNGTPLDSHNLLGRVLKPAWKRAGLPSISWHSLWHTHATLLSDLGESLKTAGTIGPRKIEHDRGDLHARGTNLAACSSRKVGKSYLDYEVGPKWTKSEEQQTVGSSVIQ
jgi:integrase